MINTYSSSSSRTITTLILRLFDIYITNESLDGEQSCSLYNYSKYSPIDFMKHIMDFI
jgi:hypothetical protein